MIERADGFARFARAAVATPWRWRGAAFLAGGLSILAMAPFFLWPVLWLTLPMLLAMLAAVDAPSMQGESGARGWRASSACKAAGIGWCFGFGYHVFGLFWIGEAFLVEAEVFAWLLPFAVTLLPAALAIFTAAACAFAVMVAPRDGIARVAALAAGLGGSEWLRGHMFTGLPWNVLGYALTGGDYMLQSVALFGIYGLTIVAVGVFALPAALWRRERRVLAVTVAVVPCMLLGGYRLPALMASRAADVGRDAPMVRIVQPSIAQREKWQREYQRRNFDDHLALSLTAPDGVRDDAADIALIVWPEAAMAFLPLDEPVALADVGRMLPPQTTLASGAMRAEPPLVAGGRRRVYNSLMLFGAGETAVVHGIYDKTHLVPFGEYLPLQSLLEAIGLEQLSRLRGGFASGPEPRPLLDVPGVGRVAPLICYEAIFPGRVVQTQERPRAFLNVTNDGWFGNTTGPRQHLHMARVRAVEEGVPVIRAANNGISAVIDAYGRIREGARLDLNVRGTLDARLPPVLPPPLYARIGDGLFMLMLIGLLAGLFWHKRQGNLHA